jgi:hypothetical protein
MNSVQHLGPECLSLIRRYKGECLIPTGERGSTRASAEQVRYRALERVEPQPAKLHDVLFVEDALVYDHTASTTHSTVVVSQHVNLTRVSGSAAEKPGGCVGREQRPIADMQERRGRAGPHVQHAIPLDQHAFCDRDEAPFLDGGPQAVVTDPIPHVLA